MRGEDGLDEFTTGAATKVWAVADGTVTPLVIDAADLGLARSQPDDLRGGDPSVNAAAAHSVFAGDPGPVRDAVILNAAAGIAAYEGWAGRSVKDVLTSGIARATEAVDSGAAAATLTRWVEVAQAL